MKLTILSLLGFFSATVAASIILIAEPLLNTPDSIPTPEVSADRLRTHVERLSRDFVPRNAAHPAGMERASQYIQAELGKTTGQLMIQPFSVEGNGYSNVSLLFGSRTAERVIIGAHYDADDIFPGADDNASGVAGLIELAHLLDKTKLDRNRSIELVAFALEEAPYYGTEHMGSAIHAAGLKRMGVKIRAMLSLEMIGYFTDAPQTQRFPITALGLLYPSTGNFIGIVGSLREISLVRSIKRAMSGATDLPVYSLNAPNIIPELNLSDHISYRREGYPSVMITDTAFFRNPNYHTAQDTSETLDYTRMAKVIQGLYAAVLVLVK